MFTDKGCDQYLSRIINKYRATHKLETMFTSVSDNGKTQEASRNFFFSFITSVLFHLLLKVDFFPPIIYPDYGFPFLCSSYLLSSPLDAPLSVSH